MRKRKKGMRYKACEKKREKKISLLQELCRINYKIKNIELIKNLEYLKLNFIEIIKTWLISGEKRTLKKLYFKSNIFNKIGS